MQMLRGRSSEYRFSCLCYTLLAKLDPLNKLRSFGFSCPVFIKLQNFVSEVSTKNSGDRTKFQKSPDKLTLMYEVPSRKPAYNNLILAYSKTNYE